MSFIGTFLTARRLLSWPDDKLRKINEKDLVLYSFYKKLFYYNGKAEINQTFKNVLRTFLWLRVE